MANPFNTIFRPLVRGFGEAASRAKPFYSGVDQAISAITQNKGTGQQMLAEILKTKGAAKELKDRPVVRAALNQPKITKDQLQKIATDNPAPQFTETTLGKEGLATKFEQWTIPGGTNHREILFQLPTRNNTQDLLKWNADYLGGGQWQVSDNKGVHQGIVRAEQDVDKQSIINNWYNSPAGSGVRVRLNNIFQDPHYSEPNILAHARVSDRFEPNGDKALHVEEVQSAWHQKARDTRKKEIKRLIDSGVSKAEANKQVPVEYGYGPRIEKTVEAYYETKSGQRIPVGFGKTKEEAEASIDVGWKNLVDIKYETFDKKVGEGVPDSPFKENWHELVMKRLLDDAVKNGYKKVYITPGAEQAKRYNLSKFVDQITARRLDDKYDLHVTGKGGEVIYNGRYQPRITADEMGAIIGKEMAQKIVSNTAAESENRALHVFNGLDLKVGGEGMLGFYDKMVPSFVNDYGAPHNMRMNLHDTQVGGNKYTVFEDSNPSPFSVVREGGSAIASRHGTREEAEAAVAELSTQPLHSIAITPEFEKHVQEKGQRLYQAIPAGIGAGIGALTEEEPAPMKKGGPVSLDAMRLAVMNKKVQHKQYGGPTFVRSGISRIRKNMNPVRGNTIIKEGGGNWLAGGVEGGLNKHKSKELSPEDMALARRRLAEHKGSPDYIAGATRRLDEYGRNALLNQFIDKQLTRYVKNQMGTKEDPIRALAEKGPIHTEIVSAQGFPPPKPSAGQSQRAKEWEGASDFAIREKPASFYTSEPQFMVHGAFPKSFNTRKDAQEYIDKLNKSMASHPALVEKLNQFPLNIVERGVVSKNPWLTKVDPDTPIYTGGTMPELGFGHIIDELGNATNPASGLPRELLLKPESLSKLSIPQAVERVAKINEWRAAQMEKARKAAREGIPVHKEYPEGYQWTSAPDTAADEKALQYIKDVGCEGGWCTQGESAAKQYGGGNNRLYVLHDSQGKAVTQISVETAENFHPIGTSGRGYGFPTELRYGEYSDVPKITKETEKQIYELGKKLYDQKGGDAMDSFQEAANMLIGKLPAKSNIKEIKGLRNEAPREEHLPYVQDFVRSGKWSDVQDLHHTGLVRKSDYIDEFTSDQLDSTGTWRRRAGEYITTKEIDAYRNKLNEDFINKFAKHRIKPDPESQDTLGRTDFMTVKELAELSFPDSLKRQADMIRGALQGTTEPGAFSGSIYLPNEGMKRGGVVSMDAMRMAVMNKQLRKHHG